MVKCQGKIREKSVNFEVDDKWQPWIKQHEKDVIDMPFTRRERGRYIQKNQVCVLT